MGSNFGYSRPNLRPSREGSESEWAWAAGIFEGEGSCHNNSGKGYLQVRISQKDPEILHRLKEFCGGSVRIANHTGGFTEHHHMWRLELSGGNAQRFANNVWEWLSERRKAQFERIPKLRLVG